MDKPKTASKGYILKILFVLFPAIAFGLDACDPVEPGEAEKDASGKKSGKKSAEDDSICDQRVCDCPGAAVGVPLCDDDGEPESCRCPSKLLDAAYIFDNDELRTYELQLSQENLDTINADPTAEQYVEGALVFEGQTYERVGIRYKGSVGAFMGCVQRVSLLGFETGAKTCAKLSMKVSFNWQDPDARFYGMKKLQFHAMNLDSSLMRERLGYALFNEMNVPAPRVVHARLLVNGKLEGLFALVEQIDGRFTRGRFAEGGKGNLYKEIWPIHDDPDAYVLALKSNTRDPNVDKILAFKQAIEDAEDPTDLDDWLDLDYQMRYIAVDRTIVNDDGIFHWWCIPRASGNNPGGVGNHNYYWYEEADADRFWLLPWDLDNILSERRSFVSINTPWDASEVACRCSFTQQPAGCDRLTQLWATMQSKYKKQVRKLLKGPFSKKKVDAKLELWAEQIDEAVHEQAEATHNGVQLTYEAWQAALSSLRDSLEQLRERAGVLIQ